MTTGPAIIFDLDGTLLDTLGDIADTANAVLDHFGFPQHSLDSYRHYVGDGLSLLMQRSLPVSGDEALQSESCRLFLKLYQERWHLHCRPYPGIVEMLDKFVACGANMAVLSNKPHEFTLQFVHRFLPGSVFSLVYGQRPGIARKPDPAVALTIASHFQVSPQSVYFVGDTPIDIRTGKAAAMKTVAVTWGFRPSHELETESPDLLINHPCQLEQHVLSSQ
jgi:phosphoglycolate phosphatase